MHMNQYKQSYLLQAFLLFSFFITTSCSSKSKVVSDLPLMSESEYETILKSQTDRTEKYNGLYNSLHMAGSLITTPLALAQVDQKARQYLWDTTVYQAEKNKIKESLKTQTIVFLSFYTPERKHDNLHKSDSMWKVFLDCEGHRFEGKVTKLKQQTSEVQGLYAYHNRFSTPYIISFSTPTNFIDGRKSRVTVTGPAGSATLEFPQ